MRYLKISLVVLAAVALSVASPSAQASRSEAGHVQLPHLGAVSMIGVRLSDVTAENMKSLKLEKVEGAVVESVNPNSAAAAAGLRERDVIFSFDGERVRSAGHLSRLVAETPVGREVPLAVMRDGQRLQLKISPQANTWFDPRTTEALEGEWREYAEQARRGAEEMSRNLPQMMEDMRQGRQGASGRARLGVQAQPLTPDLASYFGVKSGVLVASVVPESAGAKAGLKAGDVITAVNGKAVASPRELVAALPSGEGSLNVSLSVVRDRKALTLKATLAPAGADRPQAPAQPL